MGLESGIYLATVSQMLYQMNTTIKGDFKDHCRGLGGECSSPGFPLGLENLEKWEGIFQSGKSQGILNELDKSGKSQGKSYKILENSGNLR